jgi:hypothetical protein
MHPAKPALRQRLVEVSGVLLELDVAMRERIAVAAAAGGVLRWQAE